MPTYTAVTNLPSTPASLSEADTHLSLTTPGINAQHYEWQGNSAGFWNPINDDNGGTATATFLTQRTQKFSYDFDIDGGAVGDITLRGGTVPSGIIVQQITIDMSEDITGSGGTQAALKLESAGDLQAAANVSDMSAVVSGVVNTAIGGTGILDGSLLVLGLSGDSTIKTTAARSVVLSPSAHALTGGVFDIYITYMVPA